MNIVCIHIDRRNHNHLYGVDPVSSPNSVVEESQAPHAVANGGGGGGRTTLGLALWIPSLVRQMAELNACREKMYCMQQSDLNLA